MVSESMLEFDNHSASSLFQNNLLIDPQNYFLIERTQRPIEKKKKKKKGRATTDSRVTLLSMPPPTAFLSHLAFHKEHFLLVIASFPGLPRFYLPSAFKSMNTSGCQLVTITMYKSHNSIQDRSIIVHSVHHMGGAGHQLLKIRYPNKFPTSHTI